MGTTPPHHHNTATANATHRAPHTAHHTHAPTHTSTHTSTRTHHKHTPTRTHQHALAHGTAQTGWLPCRTSFVHWGLEGVACPAQAAYRFWRVVDASCLAFLVYRALREKAREEVQKRRQELGNVRSGSSLFSRSFDALAAGFWCFFLPPAWGEEKKKRRNKLVMRRSLPSLRCRVVIKNHDFEQYIQEHAVGWFFHETHSITRSGAVGGVPLPQIPEADCWSGPFG